MKRKQKKFLYRAFLNNDIGDDPRPSIVVARGEVESGSGCERYIEWSMTITDCQRAIKLHDSTHSEEDQKNSIYKLTTLKNACEYLLKVIAENPFIPVEKKPRKKAEVVKKRGEIAPLTKTKVV